MKQESPESKQGECSIDKAYLTGIIVKAMGYTDSDPETSLMYARKSAEGICTRVFSREIGNPGNNRLDKLIELLSNKDCLPERIKIPLRVIQQYGNYAAHVQPDRESIDRSYIEPCLTALVHVTNWYFHDYLNSEIPAEIVAANNEYEPSLHAPLEEPTTLDYSGIVKEMELPSQLRPYQWEGVSFLAYSEAALLADEMGLGKTVQAIIALRVILRGSVSKRALIITPASLVFNWERELAIWAPNLVVRRVIGTSVDRRMTYKLPIQVLVATYDQIRSDGVDMGHDVFFDVVILDEAQRIKNRHSREALACRLIRRKQSWVLTGTPLENSLDDLASIFLFLKPGLIDAGMPPKEVHTRIRTHFLRRRKREVLKEIPPIIFQDMPLELSGAQQEAYTDLWVARKEKSWEKGLPVSEATMLALITKLKQLCNYDPTSGESVKWEALSVMLEDLSQPYDKIIVFSQYVDTLEFISRKMGSFPHSLYTGELSQEERDKVLAVFKDQDGPRALLMSLRAGGVGLNIQEATTVVLFDRWWNPAVEEQAIQRAHRFGREGPLHVIKFMIIDTIEKRISEILKEKRIEFETYVENADNAPVRVFTKDDLRKVLGLSTFDTKGVEA
jgi:SNF2 family DNA or RNA helicase